MAAAPPAIYADRGYIRAVDIPPPRVAGYGIVAFSALPTDASWARLIRVCRAYVASLPPRESLPPSIPTEQTMITLWPVQDPFNPKVRADDCPYLIQHYDLFAGTSAIEDAARQRAAVEGRGPYLLAWRPGSARGATDKLVLVYDLSRYESQDSFDRAFQFWQRRIVANPAMWTNGWSIEPIRLAVRDFFDTYAEAALQAISLAGGK